MEPQGKAVEEQWNRKGKAVKTQWKVKEKWWKRSGRSRKSGGNAVEGQGKAMEEQWNRKGKAGFREHLKLLDPAVCGRLVRKQQLVVPCASTGTLI